MNFSCRKKTSDEETPANKQLSAEEIAKIKDVVFQDEYQKEELGAPPRISWNDYFRHYPEQEFFKQGRYILSWTKYPGTKGHNGERWELWQIMFKDPANISTTHTVTVDDIEETNLIFEDSGMTVYDAAKQITLPTNLLLPDKYSGASSEEYKAITINVNKNTQTGHFPITLNVKGSRTIAVGYKIRIFRTVDDTDDKGNEIKKEMHNDSPVLIVRYKDGLYGNAGGSAGDGEDGDGGESNVVPDELTSMADVRASLGFSANQNFKQSWEDIKASTSPVSDLINKDDWDKVLFPNRQANTKFHDKDGTYYTYNNFLEASKYFPKFLSEGSKEDRYRELAAFLGHKSHEVGDGWPALKEERWSYGLVWIEELSHFESNTVATAYIDAGNTNYPPTPGKSYHGRGPVQLSWNYNYGMMSEMLFGDKQILLDNPNLISKNGFLGFASAIWFWMQPQGPKPSCHDVMVGNVKYSPSSYTPPTSNTDRGTKRVHANDSHGWNADGTSVSYAGKQVPLGSEVGFGLTINIINGGLESGTFDGRHGRRLGFFARYLDYFGKTKMKKSAPISPKPPNGGDPVPQNAIDEMKNWRNWWNNAPGKGDNDVPDDIPSVLVSKYASPF